MQILHRHADRSSLHDLLLEREQAEVHLPGILVLVEEGAREEFG